MNRPKPLSIYQVSQEAPRNPGALVITGATDWRGGLWGLPVLKTWVSLQDDDEVGFWIEPRHLTLMEQ